MSNQQRNHNEAFTLSGLLLGYCNCRLTDTAANWLHVFYDYYSFQQILFLRLDAHCFETKRSLPLLHFLPLQDTTATFSGIIKKDIYCWVVASRSTITSITVSKKNFNAVKLAFE